MANTSPLCAMSRCFSNKRSGLHLVLLSTTSGTARAPKETYQETHDIRIHMRILFLRPIGYTNDFWPCKPQRRSKCYMRFSITKPRSRRKEKDCHWRIFVGISWWLGIVSWYCREVGLKSFAFPHLSRISRLLDFHLASRVGMSVTICI